MFYRVRQFVWGLTAKITEDDRRFIETYLNYDETELFSMLPRHEQVHALKVARQILSESLEGEYYDIYLIKAGLLHDIGKIYCRYGVVKKSILVLMDKFFPKVLKKLQRLKCVEVYYNHAEIAVTYLEDEDNYLKYLIRNHHNYEIQNDAKLKLLHRIDSQN